MILNIRASFPKISLKITTCILCVLLWSCGEDTSKKSPEEVTNEEALETTTETANTTKTIVFFGDSLTAGYGLDNSNDAYPALIQATIDSLQLNYTVVNSGLSGETTSGGRSRIDWVLNQNVDVFVLELGANDGLRGITLSETRENLQAIIDAVKAKYPTATIILAGMQLPPNLGQEYTAEFKTIFDELAEINQLEIIPFLLKDVGGIPNLNLADGIHPNEDGQKIVAKNVWEVLGPLL